MPRLYLSAAFITSCLVGMTACSNYQTMPPKVTSDSAATIKTNSAPSDAKRQKWSYDGDTGPEFWGDIKDASACKIGQKQSPIDIKKVTASTSAAPVINYAQEASIRVNDNGHTIVYTPTTANNSIMLDGERFELKQFHYHTPSEHQFAGQNYPAEIHFVHANNAGNLAVIAVMLKQGAANDVVRLLLNGTQLSAENQVDFTANGVDLSALIPAMPTFYHYEGSLTTPPCSEQVQWFVTKEPLALANDQLAIMTDLYEGNNRPVQQQGKRVVEQVSQ